MSIIKRLEKLECSIKKIFIYLRSITNNNSNNDVNVVSDTEIIFNQRGFYTYIGETDISSVLPPNNDEIAGTRYVILNTTGAGSLTIIGNIYEAGEVKSELTITPGENYIIINNGIHWVVV